MIVAAWYIWHFTSVDVMVAKQSLLAHVVDQESIGDGAFRGQRHAAYVCCTEEAHAKVWGFLFLTTGWQVLTRLMR